MELNRRKFLKLFGAACVGGVTGIHNVLLKAVPVRVLSAVKSKFYPGAVKDINYHNVRRPGKWLG